VFLFETEYDYPTRRILVAAEMVPNKAGVEKARVLGIFPIPKRWCGRRQLTSTTTLSLHTTANEEMIDVLERRAVDAWGGRV
jgi:hypothetical protein